MNPALPSLSADHVVRRIADGRFPACSARLCTRSCGVIWREPGRIASSPLRTKSPSRCWLTWTKPANIMWPTKSRRAMRRRTMIGLFASPVRTAACFTLRAGRPVLIRPACRPLAASAFRATCTEPLADGNRLLVTVKVFHPSAGIGILIESGGPMAPIETILSHLLFSLLIGVPLLALVAVGGGFVSGGTARWRPWCKSRAAPNKSPCII